MKRFDFRLSSLLDFREYLERLAKKEIAVALRNVKNSQKAIDKLKDKYIKTAIELDQIILKGMTTQQLQLYNKYLDIMDQSIVQEKLKKNELNRILDQKMLELTKKTIDKKVIEKLKQKKKAEYMEEYRKSEQKIIDEIVSLKKARELNYESASEN